MRTIWAAFSVMTMCGAALAASEPPKFDAAPGCRAGASTGVKASPDIDGCMRSENEARDTLVRQWSEFAAEDRTRCGDKTHMGGPPSYVEVLTCLELARDARKLPKDDSTGLDIGQRR